MSAARFSIGIDLGTTNSALAYAPLNDDTPPETLPIQQWETPETLVEVPMLPSFLYLPEDALAQRLRDKVPGTQAWIVGRLARRRAAEMPGRVVRSAKSWLCHHTADRAAPILPWGSEDIRPDQKISPVRPSALILNYLRGVWNNRFADCAFDDQEVTVTVPASFDVAAQKLTLAAAEEARFPGSVKLLEEPQAAFYCWLEQHPDAEPLWAESGAHDVQSRHVLVVDIGGGTSDFSLFEVWPGTFGSIPDIRRVAVSEHILLGGDNIDLALAVLLETRLSGGERGHISGPRWDQLVALCRDLKEKALSGSATADDRFAVALPGRGSGLIAGSSRARARRIGTSFSRPSCSRYCMNGGALRARRAGCLPLSRGCFPATAGSIRVRASCIGSFAWQPGVPASPSASAFIRSVTALPPTSWSKRPISASSKFCSKQRHTARQHPIEG